MAGRSERREARTRIFVGCEGRGEQAFIRWLQELSDAAERWLHLDAHDLAGGAPGSMLVRAAAVRDRSRKTYGSYRASALLLDADQLPAPSAQAAFEAAARRSGFEVIWQRPNQEGLLLRLHGGEETRMPPSTATGDELRRVWPDHRKPVNARLLNQRFSKADLARAAVHDDQLQALLRLVQLDAG